MAENPETTKDKYVEVMREDMRETISSYRKHQREIVLNKNRQALGEISNSLCFSKEFILAKAHLLKKKPLAIEDYQQLQNALIQSEENINTFLKVENIVYALVRDLSGKNPVIQLYAASCCCNIALGNSKVCTILVKSAAPYLIGILDTLNYPLMDICIWTIGNLVGGSEKAFETLYAQGCLRHLVSLMCNCDISILPSVIYASIHCIYAGTQYKQYDVIDEIVPVAETLSERFSECIRSNASWLLALLSSEPACTIPLLKVVPSAVNYLYSSIADELSDVIRITGKYNTRSIGASSKGVIK
ncbi:importin subunit alpha-2 isoform X2 [Cephus cinctus]|uniref:Importin subunit alpha-2 isoform X2 n=1 Tax=Cephus cinctus TaxID=211228 RepID=A0AAJ7BSA5_CEPCN|nr:importin subunit alpha-2 isoform X2 [Cephus cinctus]XP_024939671.1 importin subunit alpha-2 isoform X2 [Cephus cinctus]